MRDINEGFPSDSIPHTEYYDYQSDSDLEDELSEEGEGKARGIDHIRGPAEGCEPKPPRSPLGWGPPATSLEHAPQQSRGLSGIDDNHR